MNNKNNCLICEAEIEYFAESKKMPCSICGEVHETAAACKNGHYICDSCHAASAFRHIYKYCLDSKSQDPTQIMRELMNLPSIHMHGPEHHVLVGAALLTAYHNAGGELPLGIAASLQEMTKRGKQVPGGCCGLWGACGAAISSGMFVSLLTGASPLSTDSWRLANQMTAKALEMIAAHGGPRCCKRDGFWAALAAADFCREHFGITLQLPEKLVCEFSPLNRQCLRQNCLFNPKSRLSQGEHHA